MKKEMIREKLDNIIDSYAYGNKVEVDADLMAKPVSLPSYDMAALFLEIEREFSVDLDQLVPVLEVYSPNQIAGKVMELCECKE